MTDRNTNGVKSYVWISVAATTLAFAIAAILTYFLLYQAVNDDYRSSLASRKADQIANYFDQKQALLQLQLATFSLAPQVTRVFTEDSIDLLRETEEILTHSIPFAVQTKLIPAGTATVDMAAKPSFTFAAKDMVVRAEGGQPVYAEAMRNEGEWIFTMVQPVVDKASGEVLGTIFVFLDTRAFSVELDVALNGDGEAALLQSFDINNLKPILILGEETARSSPISRSLKSPNWRVQFSPAPKLMTSEVGSPLTYWLPLVISLPLALIASMAGLLLLNRHLIKDIKLLMGTVESAFQGSYSPANSYSLTVFKRTDAAMEDLVPDATSNRSAADAREIQAHGDATDQQTEESEPHHVEAATPDGDHRAEANKGPEGEQKDLVAGDRKVEDLSSIFRAYDIRGIADEYLTSDNAYRIAQAIGAEAEARGVQSIIVAADGRVSSPAIVEMLVSGLIKSGRDVIDLGIVPTPLLYFATQTLDSSSGVMVTASHNPANYNGFKVVLEGKTLEESGIQQLYARYLQGDFTSRDGKYEKVDITDDYMDRVCDDVVIARPLQIAIDCGNGVAGVIAPDLFANLGCEVIPLYCDVDGSFPNHDPDPTVPENLADLIATVTSQHADLGIAFDGDGDRLVVVSSQGNIIWPDRLLMLFAKDIVSRNPGIDVVYDVKCTRHLNSIISSYGGRPIICRSGHSFMKAKLEETDALLAGEMSGHICFKERWYGFDDGLYSAARLLEIVGSQTGSLDDLLAEFPISHATPEIRISIDEQEKFEFVSKFSESADFGVGNVTTVDGLRVDYADGWGLLRASNTTPNLTMRFEADDAEGLARIKELFRREILAIRDDLDLGF